MRKLYLLALAAILLHGCIGSGSVPKNTSGGYKILASSKMCPDISQAFFIPDWQFYSALAVTASASILAVLYMINTFFGNSEGAAWVKLEIFELGATVFIAMVLVGLIDAACVTPVGFLISSPEVADLNVFDAAAQTLDSFSLNLIEVTSLLHTVYIPIDFITTTTMTAHPLGMGTAVQPSGGMGAVVKPTMTNALQMMSVAYIIIRAQLLALDFSTFAFIKYYLPLGFLMRCFAPTRRIGGTLIGLSVGLVLVFPSLVVLNGLIVYTQDPFDVSEYLPLTDILTSDAFEPLNMSVENFLSLDSFNPFNIFHLLKIVLSAPLGVTVSLYMFLALRTAGVAFLLGLFFPALNTLVLVTTVRYLTRSFGEEIDVSNLTRMI